jgi:hypothetical protein
MSSVSPGKVPLYYFDISDDNGVHRDDVGVEFPNFDTAVLEARRTLAEMSREALPAGPDQTFEILVRDHGEGPVRFVVSITTKQIDQSGS